MNTTLEVGLATDFDGLYHTYQARVYRQCLRMLRNQADAEDLTQEVFLRLFQKVNTFRGESRFSTWLHRLTINIVLMQLRRERRRPVTTASLGASPRSEEDNPGLREVESACGPLPAPIPDRVCLEMAIAQLSTRYREVFLLHDVEGYGHEEVGRLLGISEGTSKSQLHKARQRLRVLLIKGKEESHLSRTTPRRRPLAKKREYHSCDVHFAAA